MGHSDWLAQEATDSARMAIRSPATLTSSGQSTRHSCPRQLFLAAHTRTAVHFGSASQLYTSQRHLLQTHLPSSAHTPLSLAWSRRALAAQANERRCRHGNSSSAERAELGSKVGPYRSDLCLGSQNCQAGRWARSRARRVSGRLANFLPMEEGKRVISGRASWGRRARDCLCARGLR